MKLCLEIDSRTAERSLTGAHCLVLFFLPVKEQLYGRGCTRWRRKSDSSDRSGRSCCNSCGSGILCTRLLAALAVEPLVHVLLRVEFAPAKSIYCFSQLLAFFNARIARSEFEVVCIRRTNCSENVVRRNMDDPNSIKTYHLGLSYRHLTICECDV